MSDRLRVPIRCCCNPMIVLGTVIVPVEFWYVGARVVLPVPPDVALDVDRTLPPDVVALDVDRVYDDNPFNIPVTELALKSNETPIETLRRMPSFVEINYSVAIGMMPPSPAP